MSIILISWGTTKPDQRLVDLMIEKAKAFHCVYQPEFKFGFRWPAPDGSHASYDDECWQIRDDMSQAGQCDRGVEACQGLLEGLQAGWDLALKCYPPPVKKVKK